MIKCQPLARWEWCFQSSQTSVLFWLMPLYLRGQVLRNETSGGSGHLFSHRGFSRQTILTTNLSELSMAISHLCPFVFLGVHTRASSFSHAKTKQNKKLKVSEWGPVRALQLVGCECALTIVDSPFQGELKSTEQSDTWRHEHCSCLEHFEMCFAVVWLTIPSSFLQSS